MAARKAQPDRMTIGNPSIAAFSFMDMAVPKPRSQEQGDQSASGVTLSGEGIVSSATTQESFCVGSETGQLCLWSWNITSSSVAWSSNLECEHGPAKSGLDGTISFAAEDIPPQNKPGVLAAIRECLRTGKSYRLEYQVQPEYDERWFEVLATPIVRDDVPVQVLGMCQDITERRRISREVGVRARQQEAIAQLSEHALAERNLQKFFNAVVATVSDVLNIKLVKILEMVPGDTEMVLRAGVGWPAGMIGNVHVPTDRQSHAGYALAAKGPIVLEDIAAETRFPGSQLLRDQSIISGISTPIAGRDGRAYGVLCAHSINRHKFNDYDISFLVAVANVAAGAIQRRQLDQRNEMMIRELRHRSGNLFSQLLALFSQTAKNSSDLADLVAKYEGRVLALANAHRLITEGGWKSASLNEILDVLLAPYVGRISLRGPYVFLEPDPTFSLSIAVHELVANAGKHGSLSEPSGRVDLSWSVSHTRQGLTLTLDWNESGGARPATQRQSGLGTRLIMMVIERQLNGQVQQNFAPEGLQTRLIIPLTHERWRDETMHAAPEPPPGR
jgi:two-component sensor histidine kinase